jgi:hypothetical protein
MKRIQLHKGTINPAYGVYLWKNGFHAGPYWWCINVDFLLWSLNIFLFESKECGERK